MKIDEKAPYYDMIIGILESKGVNFEGTVIEYMDVDSLSYRELYLGDGEHELGFGRFMNDGRYINLNERCDSVYFFLDEPGVKCICLAHFHRRGSVYGITVYTH